MTTKELFISEVNKLWMNLKNRDDVIFENIAIDINAENKFEELKENSLDLYRELMHENSIYNKKRMVQEYFWDKIVGDLYESTLDIMRQANLLEEAQKSFEKSYKIGQKRLLLNL